MMTIMMMTLVLTVMVVIAGTNDRSADSAASETQEPVKTKVQNNSDNYYKQPTGDLMQQRRQHMDNNRQICLL